MGMKCAGKTWLQMGGKVHRTLWALWIDAPASSTGHSFFGLGIWLPPNKNIAPVLFNYNWLSAEWCISLSEGFFFFLCVDTRRVFGVVGLGRYTLNKCHFSLISSASFLSVDPFKLSIPFLPLSSPVSFFSTSRRVLLYSFVILIDCINLLSIEFPVHHAEHNVEYYHNPSK